jgi:hypothetical protein
MILIPLTVAAAAVAAGSAALLTARGLRRDVAALREDLLAARAAAAVAVPAARTTPDTDAIRGAVADALADERERELAEARAFWAAQEARESADAPLFGATGLGPLGPLAPLPGAEHSDYEVLPHTTYGPFLPRQADLSGLAGLDTEPEQVIPFRHPSDPDFGAPTGFPSVVANQEQTAERLTDLADARIPLADVRPGPLGTLDVYVFADGTTLCMTPGHRETALQLSDALDRGETPVLLGGSAIAGAYALTFTYGEESVYILADRVVASL